MKRLFTFFLILTLASLACAKLSPTQATATTAPAVAATEAATTAPQAATTAPEAATTAPETATTTSDGCATEQFFTDEFNSTLCSAWTPLIKVDSEKQDSSKVTVEPQDGKLVWNFGNNYVYYYLFYKAFTYTDVKVEVNAENRGKNNNSISLVCRYDPNVGWYEFNIASSGLYNILYAQITSDGKIKYNKITNGASNNIHQGKAVNDYSITCSGNNLTLTINDKEVKTIAERKYSLQEGQVGVSVSSYNVLPIQVEMDWFKVSQP